MNEANMAYELACELYDQACDKYDSALSDREEYAAACGAYNEARYVHNLSMTEELT